MFPKIEILLPIYNAEDYLAEALNSILNQSYRPIQLLVRDDASEDRSLEILTEYKHNYPDQITIFPSRGENLGATASYSYLMEKSRADYVMLAASDDVWLPEKIQISFEAMQSLESENNANIPLLVSTDLTVTNASLEVIHSSYFKARKFIPKRQKEFSRVLVQNSFSGGTFLCNRSLINRATPISSDCSNEDWWIALVALGMGRTKTLQTSHLLYRQHSKNTVGAGVSGWQENIKKIPQFYNTVKRFRLKIHQAQTQATAYLASYKEFLSAEHISTLEKFISLDQMNFIEKRWAIFNYGLFHQTIWHTSLQIFLI